MPKSINNAKNLGCDLDLDILDNIKINHFAAQQRIATLTKRRSIKGIAQTTWLLKAITCMDLTTLAGDDTLGRVQRLCAKAKTPIRQDILAKLELLNNDISCAAICVYLMQVKNAIKSLGNAKVAVAAVATGFPAGQITHASKLKEIKDAVKFGASEIDVVITREHVLQGNWRSLYNEVKDFCQAAGNAHVKVILATGDLRTLKNVAKAAQVAMMAGADFIKTSTGKEDTNATLLVALIMARMIRDYFLQTGYQVGFKPAGGIATAKLVLQYQILMMEELGPTWLEPTLFRIGASSLLGDIEKQLEHQVSGYYSAANRHAMA